MENWSRVIDSTTALQHAQPSEDARLARAAGEEFFLMGMPRVNVLLAGRDEVIRLVLRTLLGHVRKPIVTWSPGEPFVLPAIEHPGTLVLHQVGALTIRDQVQLLEWSDDGRRNPQVISTTTTPLLPLVRAATFIDTLYSRLNTVYLDLPRVR
jgi:hypothetical protein